MSDKIIIKKNPNGDTRTAPKGVTFEQFQEANDSHREDVRHVMKMLSICINNAGNSHDWTKKENKMLGQGKLVTEAAASRKCRCNKAEVIEIYNLDGTVSEKREVASFYDESFIYKVGKTVKVKDFDTNRWEECTRGIHFFINRQEAINYKE